MPDNTPYCPQCGKQGSLRLADGEVIDDMTEWRCDLCGLRYITPTAIKVKVRK